MNLIVFFLSENQTRRLFCASLIRCSLFATQSHHVHYPHYGHLILIQKVSRHVVFMALEHCGSCHFATQKCRFVGDVVQMQGPLAPEGLAVPHMQRSEWRRSSAPTRDQLRVWPRCPRKPVGRYCSVAPIQGRWRESTHSDFDSSLIHLDQMSELSCILRHRTGEISTFQKRRWVDDDDHGGGLVVSVTCWIGPNVPGFDNGEYDDVQCKHKPQRTHRKKRAAASRDPLMQPIRGSLEAESFAGLESKCNLNEVQIWLEFQIEIVTKQEHVLDSLANRAVYACIPPNLKSENLRWN